MFPFSCSCFRVCSFALSVSMRIMTTCPTSNEHPGKLGRRRMQLHVWQTLCRWFAYPKWRFSIAMLAYCRGIKWVWLHIYPHTGFHVLVSVHPYFAWHLQLMSFPLTDASSIIKEGTSAPSSGAIIVHQYTRIGMPICVYMKIFLSSFIHVFHSLFVFFDPLISLSMHLCTYIEREGECVYVCETSE